MEPKQENPTESSLVNEIVITVYKKLGNKEQNLIRIAA